MYWQTEGFKYIISNSIFRNCGVRDEKYDQYNDSPTRGCPADGSNTGCKAGSAVFYWTSVSLNEFFWVICLMVECHLTFLAWYSCSSRTTCYPRLWKSRPTLPTTIAVVDSCLPMRNTRRTWQCARVGSTQTGAPRDWECPRLLSRGRRDPEPGGVLTMKVRNSGPSLTDPESDTSCDLNPIG